MTTDDEADEGAALPVVAPDWVPLIDLPKWVADWLGVSVSTVAAEVVDAVWNGELRFRHRIRGVEPHVENSRRYGRQENWPPGLEEIGPSSFLLDVRWGGGFLSHEPSRVVALDWTAADVDRRDGTVGGWPNDDGIRERLGIEVWWVAVKRFAANQKRQRKQKDVRQTATPAPPLPDPESKPKLRQGGRPRRVDQDRFDQEIARRL